MSGSILPEVMTPFDRAAPAILVHARGEMIVAEVNFWQRVREELKQRGNELVLITHHHPKTPMDVPYALAPNGLENFNAMSTEDSEAAIGAYWPDAAMDHFLLDREENWRGGAGDQAVRLRRERGIYGARSFYSQILRWVKPSRTIIWNGTHAQEIVLAQMCRSLGCPVDYIERAFIPGMIQIDSQGILGGSRLARQHQFIWQDNTQQEYWQNTFDKVVNRTSDQGVTWWNQPGTLGREKTRALLNIPENRTVLLFAGQVDSDAQNLLFSPLFNCSLDAFRWFCNALENRKDIFILGKHHPKSTDPVSAFNAIVGDRGIWTDQISIKDAIAVADRVAAVNSTVIYESLMRHVPVLSMGDSLLSGKQISYEVNNHQNSEEVVNSWLLATDFDQRLELWRDFGGWVLDNNFYAMDPELVNLGCRGSAEIAKIYGCNNVLDTNWNKLTHMPSELARVGNLREYRLNENATPPEQSTATHRQYHVRRLGMVSEFTRTTPHAGQGRLADRRLLLVSHIAFWRRAAGSEFRLNALITSLQKQGVAIDMIYLGILHANKEDGATIVMQTQLKHFVCIPDWQEGCAGAVADRSRGEIIKPGRLNKLLRIKEKPPYMLIWPRNLDDYHNPALLKFLRKYATNHSPDYLLLEYAFFGFLAAAVPDSCLTIIDTIDVLHQRAASLKTSGIKHILDVSRTREIAELEKADLLLSIAPHETESFREMLPDTDLISVLPSADCYQMSTDMTRLAEPWNKNILFVAMQNSANEAGLRSFLDNIWPSVREAHPSAILSVCGSICESIKDQNYPGVIIQGIVEDLSLFYQEAALTINPVDVGAGFKIKLLDALAAGRPIVATQHAVECLPDKNASGIITADDDKAFADAIISLLTNPEKRIALAQQAQQYVRTYFNPDKIIAELVERMAQHPHRKQRNQEGKNSHG